MPNKTLQRFTSALRKKGLANRPSKIIVDPLENRLSNSREEQDDLKVLEPKRQNVVLRETNRRTSMNPQPSGQTLAPDKTLPRSQQEPIARSAIEDQKWYATEVACDLHIKYETKYYRPHIRVWVKWQQDSNEQFQAFHGAAMRFLSEKLSAKDTYLKAGRCCLVRRDGNQEAEVDTQRLQHDKQWSEVLRSMVGKFYYENREDVKFRLVLDWEYANLTIQKRDPTYQASVHKYIYSKCKTNWQNQTFLSDAEFKAIFTESTVRKLIDEDRSLHGASDLCTHLREQGRPLNEEDFKQQVFRDGTRLLAICIFVNLPLDCLYRLLTAGKTDVDIPLVKSDLHVDYLDFTRDIFIRYQGAFRPHLFLSGEDKGVHQEIQSGIVVPVTFYERIGRGGFGEVFKAKIDPAHHHFSTDPNRFFAVKRFYAYDDRGQRNFSEEQTILSKLSKRPHRHIALHLTSWAQDGRFYLLFPKAECNLQDHLHTVFPGFQKDNVLWLLDQLFGLADAVEHIHVSKGLDAPKSSGLGTGLDRPHTGYHHDLKPENILLFQGRDKRGRTFKISDFGIAKLDWALSGSGLQERASHKSPNVGFGDRAYSAPDYAIKKQTSRPYDIWSLGCIFLEVLLWVFDDGGSRLDDFRQERYKQSTGGVGYNAAYWFQDPVNETVRLKDCVVRKLGGLQGTCKDRGVFQELVRVTTYMLTIAPDERPTAPVIRSHLLAIVQQAVEDLDDDPEFYLKVPVSRPEVNVVAAPATIPYRALSRQHSIDSRSVPAHYVDTEQFEASSFSQSAYMGSNSEPVHDQKPTIFVATHDTEPTLFGSHLAVADTNGSPSRHRLSIERPRSPSISITGPDEEPTANAQSPEQVFVWRDNQPSRAEIPTLRRPRSGSTGSKTM